MSLSPVAKDITVFKLKDGINASEAGRILEIPIDGYIALDSLDLNQKVNPLITKALYSYKNLKTNLTIIDILRIMIATKAIPENSVATKIMGNTEATLENSVGRLVTDASIEKDHQTIKIINATNVSGLGNRLARLVTHMGGDVIMVATENDPKKKSQILYIDKKTYTVEKLQKILGYEVLRETNNAISDITIIIGEDKVNNLPF
jgi:hypothetical protein